MINFSQNEAGLTDRGQNKKEQLFYVTNGKIQHYLSKNAKIQHFLSQNHKIWHFCRENLKNGICCHEILKYGMRGQNFGKSCGLRLNQNLRQPVQHETCHTGSRDHGPYYQCDRILLVTLGWAQSGQLTPVRLEPLERHLVANYFETLRHSHQE